MIYSSTNIDESQIYGDNEELIVSLNHNQLLSLKNVFILKSEVIYHNSYHEIACYGYGDADKVLVPEQKYVELNLTLSGTAPKIMEDNKIMPRDKFREATILELLQIANKKLKER